MRVLASPATGLLLAAALLTGCNDGGDEPSPAPASTGSTTPSSTASPEVTEADLEEMHTRLHQVGELMDKSGGGAADYQAVVVASHRRDPAGVEDDPKVKRALARQEALEQRRNDAITALGEEPAMADPQVSAAYDTFAAAARKMYAYQDGFNASMPALERSFDLCIEIFHVDVKLTIFSGIPGEYARRWVAEHRRKAAPCLDQMDVLDESGNTDVRRYADLVRTVIRKREAATAAMEHGLPPHQSFLRLKKANESFGARSREILAFSATLKRLTAVDEFRALDHVFEKKLGGSAGSPSSGSS